MRDLFPPGRLFTPSRIKFILFFVLSIFAMSCSSAPQVAEPPGFCVYESMTAKGVEDQGKNSVPLNLTRTFSTDDPKIYFFVRLKDIPSGSHTIRYDWYQPDGTLYSSSGDRAIYVSLGKYVRETAMWHTISVKDQKASQFPGTWKIVVSVNNEVMATNSFQLQRASTLADDLVETLPKIQGKRDPSKWGLIIGIENYSDLPHVEFAKKDALLVKDYFATLLSIPAENIETLIDSEATKGKIEGYIKGYLPLNVTTNSTIYVYFIGHGSPSMKDKNAYLVTYDGDPRFIEHTGYRLDDFYKDINALKAKQAFVFLDSCFSGATTRGEGMLIADARPTLVVNTGVPNKIISFAASEGGQISVSHPEKKHGLFTYYLLSGLQGLSDENHDERITVQELYEYVRTNVSQQAQRRGIDQRPNLLTTLGDVSTIEVTRIVE